MSAVHMPDPVASAEQYKQALLALRDKNLPDSHFQMLRAQGRSPGAAITAIQLAEAAGFKNYNAANLQYGTLASNVGALIGYHPQRRPDGSDIAWPALSFTDGAGEPNTGHFVFIMRPELLQALKEMRWV